MKRFDFYLDETIIPRLDRARKKAGWLSRSAFLRQCIVDKLTGMGE